MKRKKHPIFSDFIKIKIRGEGVAVVKKQNTVNRQKKGLNTNGWGVKKSCAVKRGGGFFASGLSLE